MGIAKNYRVGSGIGYPSVTDDNAFIKNDDDDDDDDDDEDDNDDYDDHFDDHEPSGGTVQHAGGDRGY